MDDYERDSSSENEHEQEDDITMNDADADNDADDDNDNDNDNDNPEHDEDDNDNDDDDDDDDQDQHDDEDDDGQEQQPSGLNGAANAAAARSSATPGPHLTPKWQPTVSPEVLNARTYDIVPTMAAPMATSVNAIAITPDLRYWMTGGSDGYIRKYDGPGTINGKTLLTVAQRHPFVDSVTKAGVLMSYWENAEPSTASARQEDVVLSPVYSLAVQSQALWLLSGLESGGINLQSVRHDEGKRITCLQKHTNAVSVLSLTPDEKSVLSGSWDKNIFDWDLNTGLVSRQFDGRGGQISAIEIRPAGGAPVPPEAAEEPAPSDTLSHDNGQPGTDDDYGFGVDGGFGVNGKMESNGAGASGNNTQPPNGADGMGDTQGSPANDSLFGGSPAGGSDLFGDDDGMGAFGGDDENEFSRAMRQDTARDADADADATLGDYAISGPSFDAGAGSALTVQPAPEPLKQDPGSLFGDSNIDSFDESLANGNNNNNEPSSIPPVPDFPIPPVSDASLPTESTVMSSTVIPATHDVAPQSPSTVLAAPSTLQHDATQTSDSTFLSASIDGMLRVWDRRMPNPVARIGNRPGVPPWCMAACWSPDGNWIYAGRRNGTVEEFNIHNARGGRAGWQPERVFKFPGGSGPVSCVRPMANGRHLICASHDILRLYDLRSEHHSVKHSPPPFLIVPGPPRAGVISSLYVDASNRFMLSAAGNRGWEGTSTEVLIGYEINVPP
ncbi:Uu.00g107390.m01.CDS01 [Anthostomella pinea]|uniref:Uu.00g107390.m01.CDS01 n=1 Tax=Anthostomella pinea TaxID=933095 RepID=A0AAI8YG43_9PEZI|nr:Uu.00g107390.m01.CDS01 [Anthostomella pinea]